jgi:hypothetical protein
VDCSNLRRLTMSVVSRVGSLALFLYTAL